MANALKLFVQILNSKYLISLTTHMINHTFTIESFMGIVVTNLIFLHNQNVLQFIVPSLIGWWLSKVVVSQNLSVILS